MNEHVREFKTYDEFVEAMEENERMARESTTPAQKQIGYGQYVICPDEASQTMIFGYLWTEEAIVEGETSLEDNPIVLREILEALQGSYERGYRFGDWYSTLCVEGELGSHHISRLWAISKDAFERARDNDWCLTKEDYLVVRAQIEQEVERL